eukprot:COSAG01_NODE_2637_length_7327_cov_89.736718_3_plen_250_part_00
MCTYLPLVLGSSFSLSLSLSVFVCPRPACRDNTLWSVAVILGGGRAEAEAEVLALTRLVERKLAAAPLGACVVLFGIVWFAVAAIAVAAAAVFAAAALVVAPALVAAVACCCYCDTGLDGCACRGVSHVIFMSTDGVGLAPFRAGAQATAAALAAAGNDVGVGVGGGSASEPTAADASVEAARRQFEAALRAKQAKALCEMREWQAARAQGACAGGDNGIAKLWNRREILVSFYDDRSHYLHPHSYVCV